MTGRIINNPRYADDTTLMAENEEELKSLLPGMGFPCGSPGKESACNSGDLGSIPGLGRSPGEGKGHLLQHSGLENSMDSPWGRKELDRTKRLSVSLSISQYKLKSQRTNKTLKTFSSISSCLCSTTEGPAPERLL